MENTVQSRWALVALGAVAAGLVTAGHLDAAATARIRPDVAATPPRAREAQRRPGFGNGTSPDHPLPPGPGFPFPGQRGPIAGHNVLSGNLAYALPDDAKLTYNSQDEELSPGRYPDPAYDRGFGYRWSFAYQVEFQRRFPGGDKSQPLTDARLVLGDRTTFHFRRVGSKFVPAPESADFFHDTIEEIGQDPDVYVLRDRAGSTFTFRDTFSETIQGGSTAVHQYVSQLASIVDATGRQTTIARDPPSPGRPGGVIREIQSPEGQKLELRWAGGRLNELVYADGRAVRYGYTAGELTSVVMPGTEGTFTFRYQVAPNADHMLQSIARAALVGGVTHTTRAFLDLYNGHDADPGDGTLQGYQGATVGEKYDVAYSSAVTEVANVWTRSKWKFDHRGQGDPRVYRITPPHQEPTEITYESPSFEGSWRVAGLRGPDHQDVSLTYFDASTPDKAGYLQSITRGGRTALTTYYDWAGGYPTLLDMPGGGPGGRDRVERAWVTSGCATGHLRSITFHGARGAIRYEYGWSCGGGAVPDRTVTVTLRYPARSGGGDVVKVLGELVIDGTNQLVGVKGTFGGSARAATDAARRVLSWSVKGPDGTALAGPGDFAYGAADRLTAFSVNGGSADRARFTYGPDGVVEAVQNPITGATFTRSFDYASGRGVVGGSGGGGSASPKVTLATSACGQLIDVQFEQTSGASSLAGFTPEARLGACSTQRVDESTIANWTLPRNPTCKSGTTFKMVRCQWQDVCFKACLLDPETGQWQNLWKDKNLQAVCGNSVSDAQCGI